MAISTNGTVLTRLAGALYNTQMSNATYGEVKALDPSTLANALYSRDFAMVTDLAVATTLVTNLGLSSIAGLNTWIAAQLTAAGSAKGAKIVDLLNSFAQMSSDATYGAAATSFNKKVDASLTLSQTTGNNGGTFEATGLIALQGATFSLTTSANNFIGSSNNDYFDGALSSNGTATFGGSDSLSGADGTDTVAATLTGTSIRPTLTSVETVEITGITAANTVDLASSTGYTSLKSVSSSAAGIVTFNQIASAASVSGSVVSSAGATYAFADSALAGTTDSFALTLDGATGTVTVNDQGGSNALETIAINASGGATVLTALTTGASSGTGVGVTKITVSGSANVNLGSALATQVLTVDASAATGNVTAITGASTAGQTITGGAGNDGFTLGGSSDDSVNGGAGIDTITMANGSLATTDKINGGDGVDILVLTGTADFNVADTQFTGVTSIERLSVSNASTISADMTVAASTLAKAAGIVRFSDATTLDSALNVTLATAYNATAVTIDVADVADNANFTITAAGTTATITVQGDVDGFDATDAVTGGSTTGDTIILSAGGAGTLNTIVDIENITVTATDSAVSFTSTDTLLTAATTQALTVNASASTTNTTMTFANGTTHAIIYTGNSAVDSITGGAHNDNLTLGGGNDFAVYNSANFTSADTISGGDGNDTIEIADAATVIDSDFTRITSIETLNVVGGNASANVTLDALALAAGVASVIGGTAADTIAVTSGFTGSLRVTLGGTAAGTNDSVTVGGAAALTVVAIETELDGNDVLTGGTSTGDTLRLTPDSGSVTLGANFSGFENILIATDAAAVSITTNDANIASGATLAIDGSALVTAANSLTVIASAESNGKISVTGGSGNDAITLTTNGADFVSGNAGIDTVTVATAGFTSADSLAGGDGADVITMSDSATVVDADFTNVTSFASLTSTATTSANTLTATVNNLATAAGLASITGGIGADSITIGTSFTGALRVTPTSGSDTINATGSAAVVTVSTALGNIDAGDTWTGGTGLTDALLVTTGTATAATMAGITLFETITTSGDTGNFVITTPDAFVASGVNLTVNAASLVTTNTLNFDGSAETNGTISLTGGSGADTVYGGAGADTIDGGSGDDFIDGNAGADSITGGLGNDTITAGSATDIADGGTGTDRLVLTTISTGTFVVDLSVAGDQVTTFAGAANTAIQQGFEDLDMSVANGAVTATANSAGSVITSGSGADSLTGGDGNDSLTGGTGNDTLTAGAGQDSLLGGAGDDRYVITLASGTNNETITEVSGTDTLVIQGAALNSTTRTAVDLTSAAFGSTTIDLLDLSAMTVAGATVTLGTLDTRVIGSDFADSVTGGANIDTIQTGAGNDTVVGAGSADVIDAGTGDDTIVYLLTADLFAIQAVVDSITGGNGTDRLLVGTTGTAFAIANNDIWTRANTVETITAAANTAAVTIALDVTAETAGIRNVDISATTTATTNIVDVSEYVTAGVTITTGVVATTVIGGAGADSITGNTGIDTITGHAGADTLIGGDGADVFYPDNNGTKRVESVTITYAGTTQNDVITVNGIAVTFATGGALANSKANMITAINGQAELVGIVLASANAILAQVDITFLVDGVRIVSVDTTSISNTNTVAQVTAGLVGGTGMDVMTGGAGSDLYVFSTGALAPSASVFDTITDFATASDTIAYSNSALTIMTSATAAASGTAAISAAGVATFHSADTTTALRIVAAEAGINLGGAAAVGQVVLFQGGTGDTTNAYVFISDGTDGVGAGDQLIKLTGVDTTATAFDTITLAAGRMTLA